MSTTIIRSSEANKNDEVTLVPIATTTNTRIDGSVGSSASFSRTERLVSSILDDATSMHDFEASTANELRSETKEFLHTLHKYLHCREQMDSKYQEIDEFRQIASYPVPTDSGGIEANGKDFKTEYQQKAISGIPVQTLEELYEAATLAEAVYVEKMTQLVSKLRKDDDATAKDEINLRIATIKGRERALRKATDDYGNRKPGPAVTWLYDIVRGSIEFSSATQLLECLESIQQDPSMHIVKAKNRFQNPSLSGYRDLNLHIRLQVSEDCFHVCEIQIHHKAILKLDSELHSHDYYEYFRLYFGGATSSLRERLADLKLIGDGGALDNSFLLRLLETSTDENRLKRLAGLFRYQLCEYHWALRVYKKLLQVRCHLYGSQHFKVANTYNHLGGVLMEQGKLNHAMTLFRLALHIYETTTSDDHLSVPRTYRRMAIVLRKQGNLDKAMELFEKALEIHHNNIVCQDEEEDFLFVAGTYHNMANVFLYQGKLDEALEWNQKSLEIYERTLGEEHSSVAMTYSNLANVYKEKGDYDQAMILHQLSLEIYKKTLGEEHSSVAHAYINIGGTLKLQEVKLDEAILMFRKALDIFRQTIGENHSYGAMIYSNVGEILLKKGNLKESMDYSSKALEILDNTVGYDHRVVPDVYRNMGHVLRKKNQHDKALQLFEKAHDMYSERLGMGHSKVRNSIVELSLMRQEMDEMEAKGDQDTTNIL